MVLEPDSRECFCGDRLNICDHRHRQVSLLSGPARLTCKLVHCRNKQCPGSHRTSSPAAELSIAPPGWAIGWDVLAWIGLRRFGRHWSIPQLRMELADSFSIHVSEDALEDYVERYQAMVAARQSDLELLKEEYRDVDSLVLGMDGLQPEKGHETLYVVRELRLRRVWFAVPLLSSANAEVRQHVLERARDLAQALGKPVAGLVSDKQDAFVKGCAEVFPGTPHRYCHNHFLRDVAKPVLEEDSHIKVQMRKDVRGLRTIEREVLTARACDTRLEVAPVPSPTDPAPPEARTGGPREGHTAGACTIPPVTRGDGPAPPAVGEDKAQVVLDYCAAVRGILVDDQGGPLHPPGMRMAAALTEVRQSLASCLNAKKGGPLNCN